LKRYESLKFEASFRQCSVLFSSSEHAQSVDGSFKSISLSIDQVRRNNRLRNQVTFGVALIDQTLSDEWPNHLWSIETSCLFLAKSSVTDQRFREFCFFR